jgi:hypothetical protein
MLRKALERAGLDIIVTRVDAAAGTAFALVKLGAAHARLETRETHDVAAACADLDGQAELHTASQEL